MGMKISKMSKRNTFIKDEPELINYSTPKTIYNCTESFVTSFRPQNFINRSLIDEDHHTFFDYVLKSRDAAISLLDQFFSLFENGKGVLKPGIQYGIYDLEKCEVINSHFHLLFIWTDKVFRDFKRLKKSSTSEDVANVANDFIDTVNIFLSETYTIFENSRLDELELNVFPSDGKEIISFYKNSDHQFEKIFLEYLEDMNNLISEMISYLKLKSNEHIIKKFEQIIQKGREMLTLKMLTPQQITDDVDKDVSPIIKYELYLAGEKTDFENNNHDVAKLKKEINDRNENGHLVDFNGTQHYGDNITDFLKNDDQKYSNDDILNDEAYQMNVAEQDKRYVKNEEEYKKEVDDIFKEINSTEMPLRTTVDLIYEEINNVTFNTPRNTSRGYAMKLAGFQTEGIESNLLFLLVFVSSFTITLLMIGFIALGNYFRARAVKERERVDRIALSEEFELEGA